mgnify:CR=1 FL=1
MKNIPKIINKVLPDQSKYLKYLFSESIYQICDLVIVFLLSIPLRQIVNNEDSYNTFSLFGGVINESLFAIICILLLSLLRLKLLKFNVIYGSCFFTINFSSYCWNSFPSFKYGFIFYLYFFE